MHNKLTLLYWYILARFGEVSKRGERVVRESVHAGKDPPPSFPDHCKNIQNIYLKREKSQCVRNLK